MKRAVAVAVWLLMCVTSIADVRVAPLRAGAADVGEITAGVIPRGDGFAAITFRLAPASGANAQIRYTPIGDRTGPRHARENAVRHARRTPDRRRAARDLAREGDAGGPRRRATR